MKNSLNNKRKTKGALKKKVRISFVTYIVIGYVRILDKVNNTGAKFKAHTELQSV